MSQEGHVGSLPLPQVSEGVLIITVSSVDSVTVITSVTAATPPAATLTVESVINQTKVSETVRPPVPAFTTRLSVMETVTTAVP